MNSASAQPLSGIPPAAQPAPHRAQDICARIDALLATLLLWATRTGLLGRAIAPQLHAIAGAFRALSVLLTRLAAGNLPLPVMASTPSCRAVSCRTVSCRTVHCAGPPARPRQSRTRQPSAHPSPRANSPRPNTRRAASARCPNARPTPSRRAPRPPAAGFSSKTAQTASAHACP